MLGRVICLLERRCMSWFCFRVHVVGEGGVTGYVEVSVRLKGSAKFSFVFVTLWEFAFG